MTDQVDGAGLPTGRPPSLSGDEYLTIVKELIGLYELGTSVTSDRNDYRLVLALTALEQDVVKAAKAVLVLDEAQMHDQTPLLIRKCLEFAVVAQWINATENGLDAFEWESQRNSENLIAEARRSTVLVPDDLAEAVSRPAGETPPEADTARHFQRMAEAFGAGSGIYMMYRSLSGSSHPNIDAIVRQLREDASADAGVAVVLHFGPRHDAWLYTLTISLLWAAGAADARRQNSPRTDAIDRLSTRIGVPRVLTRAT